MHGYGDRHPGQGRRTGGTKSEVLGKRKVGVGAKEEGDDASRSVHDT